MLLHFINHSVFLLYLSHKKLPVLKLYNSPGLSPFLLSVPLVLAFLIEWRRIGFMSERTREIPDNATRVRVVAHQVAISLLRGSNEALAHAGRDVARLTAGHDPDTIDRSSPEYIFGASDALSVAISAVGEAIPNQPIVVFLQVTDNAKMFAKIASRPDISTGEVIEELSKDRKSTRLNSSHSQI